MTAGRRIRTALAAAIALQALILAGMLVNANWPLWTGREVRVETIPVDPQSLFRGHYAMLRYDFGEVDLSEADWREVRPGQYIYVSLEEGDDGLYRKAGISLTRPESGSRIFLRGRIVDPPRSERRTVRVRYGIEAYFAPEEKARQLEDDLRTGGAAVLMVDGRGKAAIKDVSGRPSASPEGAEQ